MSEAVPVTSSLGIHHVEAVKANVLNAGETWYVRIEFKGKRQEGLMDLDPFALTIHTRDEKHAQELLAQLGGAMTYREKLDRVAARGREMGRQEANAVLIDAAYNTSGPAAIHLRAFALRVVKAINDLPTDVDGREIIKNLRTYRVECAGGGAGDESRGVSPSPAPKEKS